MGWQSGATLRFPGLAREVAMFIRSALPLLAVLAACGCNRPVPPAPDKPPEPQATALRDAMQQPLDKAKAARHTGEGTRHPRRGRSRSGPVRNKKPGLGRVFC